MSEHRGNLDERALALLAAHRPVAPASDLAARISASVRAAEPVAGPPGFWDRWTRLAWPAAVGASVAAAVLVLLLMRSGATAPASSVDPLAEALSPPLIDEAGTLLAMEAD